MLTLSGLKHLQCLLRPGFGHVYPFACSLPTTAKFLPGTYRYRRADNVILSGASSSATLLTWYR